METINVSTNLFNKLYLSLKFDEIHSSLGSVWPYNLTCDPSDLGHGNHNFVYDISSHYVSPFQEFNPICI